MYRKIISVVVMVMATSWAFGASYIDCNKDPDRLKLRSQELQTIVKADQDDRKNSPIDWNVVAPRDEVRRKRVGEIFAEGCLTTAQDFTAAALVFQHGNVPEHNFQAYLWAKRAVELGDQKQKLLMVDGIDRYLVGIGHKELYGTQGWKTASDVCHCLQPVEPSFPDRRRELDADWSLAKGLAMIADFDKGKPCGKPKICDHKLLPTPKGSVPGLW